MVLKLPSNFVQRNLRRIAFINYICQPQLTFSVTLLV